MTATTEFPKLGHHRGLGDHQHDRGHPPDPPAPGAVPAHQPPEVQRDEVEQGLLRGVRRHGPEHDGADGRALHLRSGERVLPADRRVRGDGGLRRRRHRSRRTVARSRSRPARRRSRWRRRTSSAATPTSCRSSPVRSTTHRPRSAAGRTPSRWRRARSRRILVRFSPNDNTADFPFDATVEPGYVWHCHILDHEDNEMMRPYKVVL